MKRLLNWINERKVEKSTIIAIVTPVLGVFGVILAPDQTNAIAGCVVAVLALVGVFTKAEKK